MGNKCNDWQGEMMSPDAGFLLEKCRKSRRKCTILKADNEYILWIAFQEKSSIVLWLKCKVFL